MTRHGLWRHFASTFAGPGFCCGCVDRADDSGVGAGDHGYHLGACDAAREIGFCGGPDCVGCHGPGATLSGALGCGPGRVGLPDADQSAPHVGHHGHCVGRLGRGALFGRVGPASICVGRSVRHDGDRPARCDCHFCLCRPDGICDRGLFGQGCGPYGHDCDLCACRRAHHRGLYHGGLVSQVIWSDHACESLRLSLHPDLDHLLKSM
mmetsp:Transcript_64558/g.114009  ORF Transcript_64558/g.114009 Transcript_64558/m.114009 type:complete len:208 (+) Transcript_64558:347-970(+)